MENVYELTLRAADGRERRDLWWLPGEAWLQDLCEKARKRGLEIMSTDVKPLNVNER